MSSVDSLRLQRIPAIVLAALLGPSVVRQLTTFCEIDPALRIGGGIDLDEFVNYLTEFSPVSPSGTDRVNELP